jgi:hypothetical protein
MIVRFLILFYTFFLFAFNAKGQLIYVYNSSGGSSEYSQFTYLSSISEPVTSVGENIENGFLRSLDNILNIAEDTFFVSPNPTYDEIIIEIGLDAQISIINSIGQMVFSANLTKGYNRINLAHISCGVYIVYLNNFKSKNNNVKLVKI